MPRKEFEAFTRLDASDVNTFLMDQSVMTFGSATARDAAIDTPVEGQVTYLTDIDSLTVYNGTQWVTNRPVMSFAGTAARGSAIPSPVEGMPTYLEDIKNMEIFDGSLFLSVSKILQIVRATDSTSRSTTSTSYTDVTGMTVTITPKKSDSAIIVIASFRGNISRATSAAVQAAFRITDSSNDPISGTEQHYMRVANAFDHTAIVTMIGYATPNTTSATTYKLRFLTFSGDTVALQNNLATGQMYAIEVGA